MFFFFTDTLDLFGEIESIYKHIAYAEWYRTWCIETSYAPIDRVIDLAQDAGELLCQVLS